MDVGGAQVSDENAKCQSVDEVNVLGVGGKFPGIKIASIVSGLLFCLQILLFIPL